MGSDIIVSIIDNDHWIQQQRPHSAHRPGQIETTDGQNID
jgi:hypothetical protein